ncbi:hypothetical protein C7B76_23410 [filamentous cyanobacterium CCP2]|jgi:hypothetical protein|nr:hypothetical protein C7B76_23410 [filamentous cyanobacterium CCP2]
MGSPSSFQQTVHRLFAFAAVSLSVALGGCSNVITTNYEATAFATYTWQVEYVPNPDKPVRNRREKFASTSLINRNGERPLEAVSGPDDQGLWWPAVPPRPSIDEMEDRRRSSDEEMRSPELIRSVDYTITYEAEGQTMTAPTNYSVYRQVVRAFESQRPLELTIAPDERFVTKADPR